MAALQIASPTTTRPGPLPAAGEKEPNVTTPPPAATAAPARPRSNGRTPKSRRPLDPALRRLGDVAAVAEILGVSHKTIRRLVDAGRLPGQVRVGRLIRFDLRRINDWISDGCPPPTRFAAGRKRS